MNVQAEQSGAKNPAFKRPGGPPLGGGIEQTWPHLEEVGHRTLPLATPKNLSSLYGRGTFLSLDLRKRSSRFSKVESMPNERADCFVPPHLVAYRYAVGSSRLGPTSKRWATGRSKEKRDSRTIPLRELECVRRP